MLQAKGALHSAAAEVTERGGDSPSGPLVMTGTVLGTGWTWGGDLGAGTGFQTGAQAVGQIETRGEGAA